MSLAYETFKLKIGKTNGNPIESNTRYSRRKIVKKPNRLREYGTLEFLYAFKEVLQLYIK